MAKKNRKPQNAPQTQNKPQSPSQPSPTELAAKLEAALIENASVASDIPEEIPQPKIEEQSSALADDSSTSDSPAEPGSSAASSANLVKLEKEWGKAIEEAKRNNDRAKNYWTRASAMEDAWNQKSKEIAEVESDLKTRKEAQSVEEKELQTKKEDLMKLQADAEAGFIGRRTELLANLEEEIRKYSARYLEHDRKILEELRASEEALEERRNKILEEKRLAEESLRESRRSIESELRQVQWLRQDLDDEKQAWKERVEQEVERGITEYVVELETLRNTNGDQRSKIVSLEESLKSVGNRSPSNMALEIENQKKVIDSLQTQLADIPGVEERNRSKKLQSENDRLFQELERIQQENQVLHLRAGKASIGVAELESLRDQRAAWECRELGYRAMIADLKADIEQYRSEVNNKEVFKSCSDADKNPTLQTPPLIRQIRALDLSAFSDDVRNLIGIDKGLFYRPQDIRSFISGLAACRLHILQGISGTGKTSLPRAFADVMNWGCEVSEVQSGWRDKNDLLGYYNTFEKKFYESPFFKHLYKACCPAYENLPFFLVLDEMNLSHPEHYFADFLSGLEQNDKIKSVSLLTAGLNDDAIPAKLLIKNGEEIIIPPNVWFIGTANHDETTKDFADKTYDRSHIMEFPRHRERFKADRPNIPGGRISFAQLQEAFAQARVMHESKSDESIQILDQKLKNDLEALSIGWGNRLEAQMHNFIPVMVACGGSVSDGLDTIIAHKLLRKIKGRFDLNSSDLDNLKKRIDAVWREEPILRNLNPVQSVGLLQNEIKRLDKNH